MYYRIKEVADMSGVSIRMLHYYDKIGLLRPENISRAGYRLYSKEDIERLYEILFYRELDFSLDEIKHILASSPASRIEVLKLQEQLLAKKRDRIDALMIAIRKIISSLETGESFGDINIYTSFDLSEMNRNKEKLKSDLMTHLITDSPEDCGAKTSNYSKEDWTVVMSKSDSILAKIYKLMDKGPENIEVQKLVGEFKKFINDNLLKCTSRTFKALGGLYVDNPIYRNYLERYHPSFPEFMKEAIYIHEENGGNL